MAGTSNEMVGGEVITRVLKANGIETVFCLAGTAHTYVLEAMNRLDVAVVSTRHETATVAAADGYARVMARPGIALIKADQGLPNAMTGLCTAQQACSPVVVLVSLSPKSWIEAGGEAANDELDMAKPFVKWARTVPDSARLQEFIEMALYQAQVGRPGVAVLGVPIEFESASVDPHEFMPVRLSPGPAPESDALAQAASMLAAAKRPMIVAGAGAALAGAGDSLRELCEDFGLPVFGHVLGRGIVPEDERLGFGWPLAQIAAKEADVVVFIGSRLSQRFGYGLPPRFHPQASFIQVDIEPLELRRNRTVDLPIVADARLFIEALIQRLRDKGVKRFEDPEWIYQAMAPRLDRFKELGRDEEGPIHPCAIGRVLVGEAPPGTIYVGDGADIQNWMNGVFPIRSERAFMDHYPLGSMGVGTPLAIGAAAAARDISSETGDTSRPVVLVTGDGSFGFYCSELNDAVLAGLKLTVIISNDGAWGTEHHGQEMALGRSYNCELGQCDYHLIGQAYGCDGQRVDELPQLQPAISKALASSKTTVLNVITDPKAGRLRKEDPMVRTVAFEDLATSLKKHHTPDIA